jgi:hypothetical protein
MFLVFSSNYSNTAPGWNAYYESNLVNLPEVSETGNLMIFPNPTEGLFTIRSKTFSGSDVKLSLTDLSGRMIFSGEMPASGDKISMDLRYLSPGIYIMISENGKGSNEYHKIIIR